ncbi:MAG: sulfite exporter TauE/SafE family protein [Candidatus Thiodiazotropha sp.]
MALLLAGALAGTAAGLLGIGGGVIIVPVLSLVFDSAGIPADTIIKVAVGTSLATIVFTAISSIWAHHQRGAVRWPLVKTMTPGVVVGSLVGAWLADIIPGYWLTVGFISFLILVSIQMTIGPISANRTLPGPQTLRGVSALVGCLSSLMGIGGGALHVPFLSWFGVPVKQAIATAAAIGFPLAVTASLGFIFTGLNEKHLPDHSLGYVNLPAFAGVVAASILFAPLGAALAHKLPDRLIKRVFALFLFLLAMRMAYKML